MIRNALKDKGVKANWLAAQLGVSSSTVYDLMAGRRELSVDRAAQIAEKLGISLADFFCYRVSESLNENLRK